MKTLVRFSVAVSVFFLLTSVALANSSWYAGLKVGQMSSDLSGLDDGTNGGVLIGYQFGDQSYGNFALEAEYTTAISEGDATVLGFTGDWDVDTLAIYAVYRSPGKVYFKGKVGFLDEDVSINVAGVSASGSESGGSYGAGLGWRIVDSSSVELEYTLVESDVNFFSFGYNYHF